MDLSFSTKRFFVRPLQASDREFYTALYTNPRMMRYIGPVLSQTNAERAFDASLYAMQKRVTSKQTRPKLMSWIIISKETNQAIGMQALRFDASETLQYRINGQSQKYHIPNHHAEFGIMLTRGQHGLNVPEEVFSALIQFSRERLQINGIFCIFTTRNRAVSRFISNIGFTSSESISPLADNKSYHYLPLEVADNIDVLR